MGAGPCRGVDNKQALTQFTMGLCQSSNTRHQIAQNSKIEREIRKAKDKEVKTIKLLLLGPGECGKSTILKQMVIIHNNGFSEDEIQERKAVIYSNTLTSMAAILHAMEDLEIPLDDPEREEDVNIIYRVIDVGDEFLPWTDEVYNALKQLWSDKGVQECFERRSEYQLNDSASYFLEAMDRIHMPGFKPTDQDILRTRVATTGVTEVVFTIKGREFRVYDVGGQRSERRKWIHCFDHVNAVIFIVAISEYDQTLFEDESTNRMVESMQLFSSICNSAWFVNTSMILFLNKKDLFEIKINKNISIKIALSDYEGEQTYEDSIAYIKEKFHDLNQNPAKKTIYMHETCATDTNQVQLVIASVVDIILKQNLQNMGMG